MIKQSPGKIFLADQRGLTETNRFRRYSTFNFGPYFDEHKGAVGGLYVVNEETLAGGHQLEFTVAVASYVVLLPITGSLTLRDSAGTTTVEVEEVHIAMAAAGTVLRLGNPYEAEAISFLQLWIKAELPLAVAPAVRVRFNAESIENRLAELVPAATAAYPFRLQIGRFAGRHEAVCRLPETSLFFAFVMAGAFELEGRLLHEKDGLALWQTDTIELEALSNNALILVVELAQAGW